MISLADFGSFHVGGRRVLISGKPPEKLHFTGATIFENDPNGDYHIEQAYIQYFIPANRKFELPVLLVHGGGMTGANWETTPDGRSGWLQRFLEAGFATYVIDNVERGRSGWCALPGEWEGNPVMRSEQQAWVLFRFGTLDNFASGQTFEGSQFPVEALESFARQFVPRWTTTTDIMRRGVLSALERIGPCAVICHSQGGDLTLETIATRPDLVRHVVALEPSGFPDPANALEPGEQHWLFIMGDFIEASPFWINLMERTQNSVDGLTSAGAEARLVHLPKQGILGNSHMLMMDRNSNQVADLAIDWLSCLL
tara:strand:- start:12906 stop:13841 length:936 start_codon:yes stop_codon:yes gene_type:complete